MARQAIQRQKKAFVFPDKGLKNYQGWTVKAKNF